MGILDASLGNAGSQNTAKSWSNTNGTGATQASNVQAQTANASAYQNWLQAAEYNAEQARIQREWQERMSNTVYQRSIEDMKKAGINPILAANMGLGTASVGSGATASLSSPATFMGQAFADQNSASEGMGSSWSHSESGLATFISSLGGIFQTIAQGLNSGLVVNIDNSFDKLYDKLFPPETQTPEDKEVKKSLAEAAEERRKEVNPSKYATYGNKDYSGGLPRTGARGEEVVY